MTETLPQPGIYEGVEADVYRAWPAANNTDLTRIYEFSPMHAKYMRENPPEPTPALAFGSALHCAVLEPAKFAELYEVMPDFGDMRSSKNRDVRDAWIAANPGKRTVKADEHEIILNILQAVSFNAAASGVLGSPGPNELSAVFAHEENGCPCKLRADGWRPEWETVLDVKTTENASRAEFERSIAIYGYHRQAAFYLDGLRSLGLPAKHFAFICVEKKAPYGVAVYRLMEDAIEAGRDEIRRLVRIWKNCHDTGKWYGYEAQFQDISLPAWKVRQLVRSGE